MNLFHLRYFVTLAKLQNYTQAARQLNITQPSLSNAIHRLEDGLGLALFVRQGRNIVLTLKAVSSAESSSIRLPFLIAALNSCSIKT